MTNTGILTLDAQGNPGAVWIFQMSSTLTTEPLSQVQVINNGSPCNVFWQVGSSATVNSFPETRADSIGKLWIF